MQIHPTEAEFLKLARRGNVIPVHAELSADFETPVSAYMKLDDGRFSFLLESAAGGEKVARFSFLGARPRMLITASGRHMEISELSAPGGPRVRRFETAGDPLKELAKFMAKFRPVPAAGLPRFCGGLVGFLGYGAVRYLERIPRHERDDLRLPDVMLMLADTMAIFDHAQHRLLLVANALTDGTTPAAAYRRAVREIESMAQRLGGPLPRRAVRKLGRPGPVKANITRGEFERIVATAKEDIRAGEIIQVVLSRRLEQRVTCDPLEVYRALRSLNPSPYMFLLRFGGHLALVGASPEMLVRCEDGELETRPIAGTRPRGRDAREEERLVRQLTTSVKERAEHLMLVDLGRNDLGRVARVGSVKTPEVMVVEKYSHVLHLVSSVIGKLAPGKNAFDVLRAAFPAGTVSGAPKVRAMEIIAELERFERGPYAGAVGYVSFSGNLDTCITIRTALMKDGRAFVQTGAGIVADSQPSREFRETLNKAAGMLKALDAAQRGGGR